MEAQESEKLSLNRAYWLLSGLWLGEKESGL